VGAAAALAISSVGLRVVLRAARAAGPVPAAPAGVGGRPGQRSPAARGVVGAALTGRGQGLP
jgi:hypothetical protein